MRLQPASGSCSLLLTRRQENKATDLRSAQSRLAITFTPRRILVEGENLAGDIINHDHGSVVRVGFPEPGQFLPHDSGDPALQGGIEGGADRLVSVAQGRGHVGGHFLVLRPVEVEGLLLGDFDLPGTVVPFLRKAVEDPVAALQGGVRILDGIVQAGRLGKTGEEGTLLWPRSIK